MAAAAWEGCGKSDGVWAQQRLRAKPARRRSRFKYPRGDRLGELQGLLWFHGMNVTPSAAHPGDPHAVIRLREARGVEGNRLSCF